MPDVSLPPLPVHHDDRQGSARGVEQTGGPERKIDDG